MVKCGDKGGGGGGGGGGSSATITTAATNTNMPRSPTIPYHHNHRHQNPTKATITTITKNTIFKCMQSGGGFGYVCCGGSSGDGKEKVHHNHCQDVRFGFGMRVRPFVSDDHLILRCLRI